MSKEKMVGRTDTCKHLNVDEICAVLEEACRFIGKPQNCGFRVHYNCLITTGDPPITAKIKELMFPMVINNWKKRSGPGARNMTGRPFEDVTSKILEQKLSHLNVEIVTRKKFEVASGVNTLVDIRIEKPDYPTTIISMKTWIGPGEFRNCLGDAYLTKLMYGMIKTRFYIITLVPKMLSDELVDVAKPHIDGLYQLTGEPYVDDLFHALEELYGEKVK